MLWNFDYNLFVCEEMETPKYSSLRALIDSSNDLEHIAYDFVFEAI